MIRRYALALLLFAITISAVVISYAAGEKLRVLNLVTGTSLKLMSAAGTPAAAVENLFGNFQRRDFARAYSLINNRAEVDVSTFIRDLTGSDASLRTYSSLQDFKVEQLSRQGNLAKVRANLQWATALGPFNEARDYDLMNTKDGWKVQWPVTRHPSAPPQVIPITYPRWDVVQSGARGVNVDAKLPAPKVRLLSQEIRQVADSVLIFGELVNEDTIPAFVSIESDLVGKNGTVLAHESSFDQVVHTLLPGQKTPFRIDFAGMHRQQVVNVRLNVSSVLVAGSDPLIAINNARLEPGAAGRKTLKGELVSRSGQTVNIPQVLATLYDDSGKLVWVEKTYLDKALLPQSPLPFAIDFSPDVARDTKSYSIAVNTYRIDQ